MSDNNNMNVTDRPAETSLKLSNVLQFLVLAVISWVGMNIQTMGKDIAEIRTTMAVTANDILHLREELHNHKSDPNAHHFSNHAKD